METPVTYTRHDAVARIALDDGKANALSPTLLAAINLALDRAQEERVAVVLTGRAGMFSGGFHLPTMAAGGEAAAGMLKAGFELGERLLGFGAPVVAACNGHALAMGAFLLLGADYRLGTQGAFRIGANEVAIGLTMPHFGVEMCRQRLAPAHFHRAVINAEIHNPDSAVAAGFLDRVVDAAALDAEALQVAATLGKLPRATFVDTKRRARAESLARLRAGIDSDLKDFALMFGPKPKPVAAA